MSSISGAQTLPYSMDTWNPDSVELDGYTGSGSDIGVDFSESESDDTIYLGLRLCDIIHFFSCKQ